MKCDDFLPLLATSGWFGRWRARRHARHCSACAAAASLLGELKAERSGTPMPAYLRQMWLEAVPAERRSSSVSHVRPSARLRSLRAAGALYAIPFLALLVYAVAHWKAKPADPGAGQPQQAATGTPPASEAGGITVVEIDAAQQLAWLDERVAQLAGDVEELAKASRKREIEQRIESLLAVHPD